MVDTFFTRSQVFAIFLPDIADSSPDKHSHSLGCGSLCPSLHLDISLTFLLLVRLNQTIEKLLYTEDVTKILQGSKHKKKYYYD